jgi:hypothetical protein
VVKCQGLAGPWKLLHHPTVGNYWGFLPKIVIRPDYMLREDESWTIKGKETIQEFRCQKPDGTGRTTNGRGFRCCISYRSLEEVQWEEWRQVTIGDHTHACFLNQAYCTPEWQRQFSSKTWHHEKKETSWYDKMLRIMSLMYEYSSPFRTLINRVHSRFPPGVQGAHLQ